MRPVVAALAALVISSVTAVAQAPVAPKRIRPPGLTLADAERTALTAGAAVLRTEIDALTREVARSEEHTSELLSH